MARSLTKLLDGQFSVLGFKFGIDPLIGLIPGIGDVLSLLLSLYVVWIGFQMKIPIESLRTMIGNVVIDFILGSVPAVGDVADFIYKANSRNMKILETFVKGEQVVEGEVVS